MLDSINDDIFWVGTDEGVLKINTNNDIINRFDIFESTSSKKNSDIMVHDIKILRNG